MLPTSVLLSLLAVAHAAAAPAPGGCRPDADRVAAPSTELNDSEFMTRTYAASLRGGAEVVGCGLRGAGPPTAEGNLTVSRVPVGGTIVKAILNWSVLADPASPPEPEVDFFPLGGPEATYCGTPLGDDDGPCWGVLRSYAFTLDVTCLLAPTENGTWVVRLPDSGDLTATPSAEGAALIVVWEDPSGPMRDIVVYEGVSTQITGLSLQTVSGFDAFGFGGGVDFAEATFIVGDGQGIRDGYLGHGWLNSTLVIGPFWDGDEGLSCASPENAFYDVDTVDAKALVRSGDTSLTAEVDSETDCLTWTGFVFSVSTLTITGPPPGCVDPPAPCSVCVPPEAMVVPLEPVCAGQPVELDATPSGPGGCTTLEYQYEEASTVIRPWDTDPTHTVTPTVATLYTVRVRCAGQPDCEASTSVLVDVVPDVTPGDLGNTLRAVRAGSDVALSWGSASDAATYSVYRSSGDKTAWPGVPEVASLPGTTSDLPDVPASPEPFYLYRAVGVSCGGSEGP